MAPEIFWVVGSESDVGKTTYAEALIRALSKAGHKTVGFKPYALTLFAQNIDFFLANCSRAGEKLFGGDALKLARASSLTSGDDADLVAPCNAFCYPMWSHKFLIRTGSTELENVEYFATPITEKVAQRQDFIEFAKHICLPMDCQPVLAPNRVANSALLSPEKKDSAFQMLSNRGAEVFVMEGGGNIIPAWQGCPGVNHIFLLANGTIHLFFNLNWKIPNIETVRDLIIHPHISQLQTSASRVLKGLLPVVEATKREQVLETLIFNFLAQAGRW